MATILSVLPAVALASVPSIPNTPAGRALSSWLAAFNSGDGARIDSFDRAHAPWLHGMMRLRARTGGYDFEGVERSGRFWIVFRIRERKSSAQDIGRFAVRSYEPGHITLLGVAPAGFQSAEFALDRAERTRVIEGATKLLAKYYLYPNVAKRVSEKLKTRYRHGAYQNITDGEIFAIRVSDDLAGLSGDKHIQIDFFPKEMPRKPGLHPDLAARRFADSNCGFENVDHLAHNIGYLKLDAFAPPKYCARTAIAAMSLLADSDALIIDLRGNHGGAPRMVSLIASYFFDKPTHLDDIDYPTQHATEQLWTFPYLLGRRFTDKPVYVLTSNGTFSAAEEFAYDLKSLKRATVVGEVTGGGAHLEAPHRIDGHFFIGVPFARFVNPVTSTDWEGSGVQPDVKVPAAEALAVAERLAEKQLSKRRPHPGGTG